MDTASVDRIIQEKHLIREAVLRARRAIPTASKESADLAITGRVLSIPAVSGAGSVSVYCSLPEEVSTSKIISSLTAGGKTVALPRVAGGTLAFFGVRGLEDCEPGVFGLMEPKTTCPKVHPTDIGCFLVPGLAFDRTGYRIGWGKGYYDRALAEAPSAVRIGISYGCQIIDRVPRTAGDIPMNLIVTESETIVPHPAD